uniref:Putative secreted protein n=1 Tax=Anopheles marajoara TaxID=58244 RepID=A0A2M4CFT1_9DIPT
MSTRTMLLLLLIVNKARSVTQKPATVTHCLRIFFFLPIQRYNPLLQFTMSKTIRAGGGKVSVATAAVYQ